MLALKREYLSSGSHGILPEDHAVLALLKSE